MAKVVKLTIINDLVCAYCYIGHCELLDAVAYSKDELNLPLTFEIEYRPFKLINCLPDDKLYKDMDREQFFIQKLGPEKINEMKTKLKKWSEEKKITINLNGPVSQSLRAHRLSRKAFHMGGQRYQESLLSALFKEHMENAKDIADINVLSDIAEDVGMMTKDDATIFLESDELKEEVQKMCQEARDNGITGLPVTIICGKWAVHGSQPKETFIQIFKKLATCNAPHSDTAATTTTDAPTPLTPALIEAGCS